MCGSPHKLNIAYTNVKCNTFFNCYNKCQKLLKLISKCGTLFFGTERRIFMDNEKPVVLQKNADKRRNRIIIPNFFIKKYGNVFYMNIFKNKIELIPIGNKEKEN